jgi:hypothetical protein
VARRVTTESRDVRMVCDRAVWVRFSGSHSRVDRQGAEMARAARIAAGSALVAAALLVGSGTAIAAPAAPVASTASSDGGSGGDACAHLPSSLQELLCPSAGEEGGGSSGGTGGSVSGGTGGSAASSGTGGTTGGTTGATGATTPPSGSSGPSASAPPGVVSNFLIWLAGLFQAAGL